MDKDSIIKLQEIDCNCNDCLFMQRNIDKYEDSVKLHYQWQWDYFTTIKNKLIKKARWYRRQFYDLVRWDALLTEADNMRFQFDKSTAMINFGSCTKLNKDVSFIPNTTQIETQECFEHRRAGKKL